MSDETKLQHDVNRASKAKSLLENDLLLQAWDDIENGLITGWINTDPRDAEGRELVWQALHANRKHKNALMQCVSEGKLAQKELDRIFADQDRKKKLGII